MKRITLYTWEKFDPSVEFVDEALTRLQSFARSTDDDIYVKASKRLISQFASEDVSNVKKWLCELADRAKTKWHKGGDLYKSMPEYGDSILQAAQNAIDSADQLDEIFSNQLLAINLAEHTRDLAPFE